MKTLWDMKQFNFLIGCCIFRLPLGNMERLYCFNMLYCIIRITLSWSIFHFYMICSSFSVIHGGYLIICSAKVCRYSRITIICANNVIMQYIHVQQYMQFKWHYMQSVFRNIWWYFDYIVVLLLYAVHFSLRWSYFSANNFRKLPSMTAHFNQSAEIIDGVGASVSWKEIA